MDKILEIVKKVAPEKVNKIASEDYKVKCDIIKMGLDAIELVYILEEIKNQNGKESFIDLFGNDFEMGKSII